MAYGYLLLLVALLAAPRALLFQRWASVFLPQAASKIPDFEFKKGELSSPQAQPYRVDWGPGSVFLLDTTGKIQHLNQVPGVADLQTVVLVTKRGFEERRTSLGLVRDQARDFTFMPDFQMTQAHLQRIAEAAARWSGVAAYFVLGLGWFCFEAVFLPAYAVLGLGAARWLKKSLDFDGALRLAVFSHTPAMVLAALLPWWGGREEPLSLCIFLSLGFLLFAVTCQAAAPRK